jgi:hypothetical protein
MNLIEILATKRSGHHAMLNWIIRNMTNNQIDYWYKLTFIDNSGVWHWNDTTKSIELGEKLFKEATQNQNYPKTLITNYEDTNIDYCHFNNEKKYIGKYSKYSFENIDINPIARILFIRNFYDILISRYYGIKNNIILDSYYDNRFIQIWKNHAKYAINYPKKTLKFEDWKYNDNVRGDFLFNNFNIEERYKNNDIIGTVTSCKKEDIRDLSIIPDDVKKLIRGDNELHYLIGALGYTYREI